MRAVGSLLIVAALLGGCASLQPPALPEAEPAPLPALAQVSTKARAGGVFVAGRNASLTADTRAFRAGDVLTVVLMETTQASKSAGTQLGKNSSAGFSASLRDKSSDGSLEAQRDFNGRSSSSQQNTLQGAITVVVHEVLPNGLLKVQGEKSVYLNQGEELIRLGGYVRAADVDNDNRVSSQRVANARISYSGTGHMAEANTPGWLTRWFVSALMPF
ncbi:flagellar basal body L-ring protein FlgH [Paucibacter sp. PLA-PC-4]|uniref:flagellar basal body L-ring protein FlgH n=1 Tax=Paucibacter sp. PLA-PC-4 TaxID=2993655 RepID=UPI0022489432|nr:flagellar basal body L-ring protein FlgH [Paucibacter sp. PLA-PC-4]MCX2861686.1 flagellar basal body L-ring protein FlgH [Paucibacter sp. PLA-PC-4]